MLMSKGNSKKRRASDDSSDSSGGLVNTIIYILSLLISGGIAFGVGSHFIQKFIHARELGQASLHWPQTDGLVTKCEYHRGTRGSRSATISYTYVVNGKTYSSDQVTVTSNCTLRDPKTFVRDHPVNSKILVYYHPNESSTSVLIPGIEGENTAVLVIFGSLMVLLILSWTICMISKIRKLFAVRTSRSHA